MTIKRPLLDTLVTLALASPTSAYDAAHIIIVNGNATGVGYNDPTTAATVGGNTGATLGAQRLAAFQFAADE